MELNLAGKTAIITGGASGLGRMTAEYMRREGVNLFLADYAEQTLEATRSDLEAAGATVATQQVDVRDYAQCVELSLIHI